MSAVIVELQLPKKKLEELAAKEGFSLEQFIASAASEKLAVMLQRIFWRMKQDKVHPKRSTNF